MTPELRIETIPGVRVSSFDSVYNVEALFFVALLSYAC